MDSPGAVEPILDIQVPDGTTPNNVPAHLLACVTALAAATGISRLSVSERDALRAEQKPTGRMIFNVTAGIYEWWTGAEWWPVVGDLKALLPLAGGTMTGPLILHGDPVADNGAATKRYVDARMPVGDYLPLAGGTMRGAITLAGAPVADMHAASKAYVDAVGKGLGSGAAAEATGPTVTVAWSAGAFGSSVLTMSSLAAHGLPVVLDGPSVRFTAAGHFLIVAQVDAVTGKRDVLRRCVLDVLRPAVETVARGETYMPGVFAPDPSTGIQVMAPLTVSAGQSVRITASMGAATAGSGTAQIVKLWIVRLPQVGV